MIFTRLFCLLFLISCQQVAENSEAVTESTIVNPTTVAEKNADTVAEQGRANPFAQTFDTTKVDTSSFEIIDGYIKLTWLQLKKVVFEEKFNDEINAYVPYPTFHPELHFLDGKKVQIKGYFIPMEEVGSEEEMIIISAFPYSNCFFCGGAGPESVMDIHLAKKMKVKLPQDEQVVFRGRLRLNDSDLYYLNYILEDAYLHK